MNKKLNAVAVLLTLSCMVRAQHGCLVMPRQETTETANQPLEKSLENLEIEQQPSHEQQAPKENNMAEKSWSESEGGHCAIS